MGQVAANEPPIMNLPPNLDTQIRRAAREFWLARAMARDEQTKRGTRDSGQRAEVTAGRSLDGFRALIIDTIRRNSCPQTIVHDGRKAVSLPGYFRPSKSWDLLAVRKSQLILCIELKSLGGPSFGNNANNRAEEAIGSGYDFRRAQHQGQFGGGSRPFLGYLILVEDDPGSSRSVSVHSPHFEVDPVFAESSYQSRMRILCERLMEQQVYSSAAVLATPRPANQNARVSYSDLSEPTSFRRLLTRLAAHVSGECR
jgi:hypothetical protein